MTQWTDMLTQGITNNHANREPPVSDTTQQLHVLSNTSNDGLQDDNSVLSIDKEDNESIICEDEEDDMLATIVSKE